jgi:hypothetical protein
MIILQAFFVHSAIMAVTLGATTIKLILVEAAILSTRKNRSTHDRFLLVARSYTVAGEVFQTPPQLPGLSFERE